MWFRHHEQTDEGAALTRLLLAALRLRGPLMRAGGQLGRDLGISNARWQVLAAVQTAPLSVSQISRDLQLRRQGVQPTVNALVAAGFVELVDNPNHRRARLVSLTDRGRSSLNELMTRQAAWVNDLATRLAASDLEQAASLIELIRQLLARAEADESPAG